MCIGGASPDANTPRDQALYLARQWLTNTAIETAISIFYDFADGGVNATAGEQNFGVARCPGGAARGCCCRSDVPGAGGSRVCGVCANATASVAAAAWVPKPAHVAAATLQVHFGSRPFLGRLDSASVAGSWALAFARALPPPALPAAVASGVVPGGANVEAVAVWNPDISPACAATTRVGRGNRTKCTGTIYEGNVSALPAASRLTCEEVCRRTVACRSFTVWPSGDTGNGTASRYCATHYSRCVAPAAWGCEPLGCGDGASATQSFTLHERDSAAGSSSDSASTSTACAASKVVRLRLRGAIGRCFARYGMLGGVRSAALLAVDANGWLNVSAVGEEPTYLLKTPCHNVY
jgi:hypothetical protein